MRLREVSASGVVWCLVVGAVVGGVVGFVLGRWLYIDVMPAKVCMEIDCPAEVETLVVGEAFVTIIDDPVRPDPTRVVDETVISDECHWCDERIIKRGRFWLHRDTHSATGWDSLGGIHQAEPRRV